MAETHDARALTDEVVIANICAACLRDRRTWVQLVRIEDDDGSFQMVCPVCARVCVVHLNCGTLDLGEVREAAHNTELNYGDFEVFTEVPWER